MLKLLELLLLFADAVDPMSSEFSNCYTVYLHFAIQLLRCTRCDLVFVHEFNSYVPSILCVKSQFDFT